MARLPGDTHVIQQIGGDVVLFEEGTEREVVRYPVADADLTAKAQRTIHEYDRLSPEAKSFAHFWCGYFWAHHTGLGESVASAPVAE